MNKAGLLIFFLITFPQRLPAQGEQNIWVMGNKAGLDFNTTLPGYYSNNLFPGTEGCATACDAAGQLLFYTNGFWVWNRHHTLLPELTNGVPGYIAPLSNTIGYPPLMPWTGGHATQSAAIVRRPAHPQQYYLFSLSTSGQLFYSLIDMDLNNGDGGIVSGRKSIPLATGLTEKMTTARGCNSLWLLTRARNANQYKAFEIRDSGIMTNPVISAVGSLPPSWYRYGVIKCSAAGNQMAASCNEGWNDKGGLELYDFDPKTGILSNVQLLDSGSTGHYYYGACFSPDGTRLYASTSSYLGSGSIHPGTIRQFDLSLTSTAAIAASNTTVYTDGVSSTDNTGDLKRGKDGKIYWGSGRNTAAYMHCINLPNLQGIACNPTPYAIALPPSAWTYRGMPNDLGFINPPDSVHHTRTITVCFRDSITLTADTGKWYQWDGKPAGRTLTVGKAGTYIVAFINSACQYQTDSFIVDFVPLPITGNTGYSCPGTHTAQAWFQSALGDSFICTWRNAAGQLLRQLTATTADTLRALDTGACYLRLTTASGCDTTLVLYIPALPRPLAVISGDSSYCKGETTVLISKSTGSLPLWLYGNGAVLPGDTFRHSYSLPGTYTVRLTVQNIEGCRDTFTSGIVVQEFPLSLSADRTTVHKGEVITLSTAASLPYTVDAWTPAALFPQQSLATQSVTAATDMQIWVFARSPEGCRDSAFINIAVQPEIRIPTAFSPNGDGLNDWFHPIATGDILVQSFIVYNRWGQQMFSAYGETALQGWDGSFRGAPAEMGVYYYLIAIEKRDAEVTVLKGDVSLIR